MGDEDKRKLLLIVDSMDAIRDEVSLASFIAGFKLAWGISRGLETDGLYSFDEKRWHSPWKAANGRLELSKSAPHKQRKEVFEWRKTASRRQYPQAFRRSLGRPVHSRLRFGDRKANHEKCEIKTQAEVKGSSQGHWKQKLDIVRSDKDIPSENGCGCEVWTLCQAQYPPHNRRQLSPWYRITCHSPNRRNQTEEAYQPGHTETPGSPGEGRGGFRKSQRARSKLSNSSTVQETSTMLHNA